MYATLERLDNKALTVDIFKNFAFSHQALLYPAFAMQLLIQQRVFGEAYWEGKASKRREQSGVFSVK